MSAAPAELTTERFFRLLWPNADDPSTPARGRINLWQLQGRSSSWVDVRDTAEAAAIVERQARRHDVYAATALIDLDARKRQAAIENRGEVDPKAIRGTSATASALPGAWLDVDVGGPIHGPAHKNTNLPPTYEAALALIAETIPLRPTLIIDSGHGLYAWWLFAEPWQLEDDRDREEAADLVYRLQRTFQERAKAHGWEVDGTADLARVLRPPGSINHKLAPVPVRGIEVNETQRYQPSDFDPYLLDVEWDSVVADPVPLPDDLAPVDLAALPLPPYIKKLILAGNEWQEDRQAWRYGSRSQAVWRVVNEALKAGLGDEIIASILLDARFAISENPLEKGKRARAFVAREIAKARKPHEREPRPAPAPVSPPEPTPTTGEPQTYEEAMAALAQARRALLDKDDQLEDCRTVLSETRAELEDKTAYISLMTEVLAKPNEEMSSTEKVVFLAMTWETRYRADRGRTKLPLVALEERTGLSKNTVSTASRSICERPGSPFERTKTREWRTNEDGSGQWVTTLYVRPRAERVEETIRAGVALPKALEKPKHGGSPQATEARWRRCPNHQDDDVIIRGLCSACGKVVGERRVSAQEWEVLNPQVCDSENGSARCAGGALKGHNLCDSDGSGPLNPQDVDPAPVSLFDYVASRPQERPKRCPAPGCRAMEFRALPDGSWRCLKSGHDPSRYELAAVSGGSE
jgi:hypothetical protein